MFDKSISGLNMNAVGASNMPHQQVRLREHLLRRENFQNMTRAMRAVEVRKPKEGEKKQVWRLTREFGAENNN